MDMKDRIHPLVKVGSALSIVALGVTSAGCLSPTSTPETTPTNNPTTLMTEPPEPPVGFEPSTPTPGIVPTPTVGGETSTPTESGVPAFRAPTLEELVVPAGEGGPLPEYAQTYYNVMDGAKANVAEKVGVDPSKIKTRYWDNSGSQDAFGWMLYYQIDGGGVIWPLKPDGALADYPAYFEGMVRPDGSLANLKIDSDYNNWVVAGESAAAIFGGTLPVIVDSPLEASVNGETKLVYSRWIRPGGQPVDYAQDFSQWQKTPGILTLIPEELLAQLNLNPDRTYIEQDNYYVDTYNGARLVVKENGKWRLATLEEKYGHLAPQYPELPYIDDPVRNGLIIGDSFHSSDERFRSQAIRPIWTGDVITQQFTDGGNTIEEIVGIFIMRDSRNNLVKLNVSLYYPGVRGDFLLNTQTFFPDGSSQSDLLFGEVDQLFTVGEQVDLHIRYNVPQNGFVVSECVVNPGGSKGLSCTDQYNMDLQRFLPQANQIQMFIDVLRAGEEVPQPDNIVFVPDYVTIFVNR